MIPKVWGHNYKTLHYIFHFSIKIVSVVFHTVAKQKQTLKYNLYCLERQTFKFLKVNGICLSMHCSLNQSLNFSSGIHAKSFMLLIRQFFESAGQ